jgi:ABC-type sugar transport system ATPase subunit
VYEVGDRVTILRDGKNEGTYNIEELDFDAMIEHMIDGKIKQCPDLTTPSQDEALRVENLSRKGVLNNISFAIKKGEIVGVTGLMGAGKTELGRALAPCKIV